MDINIWAVIGYLVTDFVCFGVIPIFIVEGQGWKKQAVAALIGMAFGALLFFCINLETQNFNGGICPECGTKYVAVSRTRSGQTYYECPNCFHGAYN